MEVRFDAGVELEALRPEDAELIFSHTTRIPGDDPAVEIRGVVGLTPVEMSFTGSHYILTIEERGKYAGLRVRVKSLGDLIHVCP
jgi:hypothetical protein